MVPEAVSMALSTKSMWPGWEKICSSNSFSFTGTLPALLILSGVVFVMRR